MMRFMFMLALMMLAAPVLAEETAPVSAESVRLVPFVDGQVVRLEGCPGFQTMVSFASDERIENVAVGDSGLWQVTPNRRGDLLFVKPLTRGAWSNMTVVTNRRRYGFELKGLPETDCRSGEVVYEVRFTYPAPPPPPATSDGPDDGLPEVSARNTAYTYTGASDLVPQRVFDDGTLTYMSWAVGVASPAVYAMNSDGTESLINYSSIGDYMVIERTAQAFVLRRGSLKATLFNEAFTVEGLDAFSPRPRDSRRGGH